MGMVNVRISKDGTGRIGQKRTRQTLITLFLAGLVLSACGAASHGKPKGTTRRPPPPALKASLQKEAPAKDADPKDLTRLLDRALMPAKLKATLGACVIDVSTGRVLYEKNADEPLTPASNMKLVTTAVSLDLLGAQHKLQTRLARNGDTLVLVGGGDPAFGDPNIAEKLDIERTADYARWIRALQESGSAGEIRNLVFDDSVFDSEWRHPSWGEKEYQHWYAAPVGGLTINDSCVDVRGEIVAGKTSPVLMPACSLFEVINKSTIGKGDQIIVGRPQDNWQLVVSGRYSGRSRAAVVTVPEPGTFAATVLYDMLKAECCPEIQPPQRRKVTDQAGNLPEGWQLVGAAESPLADVVQRCNTDSQNLFAEALMKLNGAAATGGSGSWAAGRVAAAQFLRKHDLPSEGVYVDDGSGLSTENRVTARMLAGLLCGMRQHPEWEAWHKSLAVGGENGTLRKRLTGILASKVFAKTGYIRGVSTLSGYIEVGPDQYIAFSFLYNNINGWAGNARQAQDQACQVLYREMSQPLATQARRP
jgi:D-alanyl-D-alanine carboxypeptidase/D-alanyl-D-alanine-endopeptidase (penicillin-binding protein 4)